MQSYLALRFLVKRENGSARGRLDSKANMDHLFLLENWSKRHQEQVYSQDKVLDLL